MTPKAAKAARRLAKMLNPPRLSPKLRGAAVFKAVPAEFAAAGGLRYVNDREAGLQRVRRGDDFAYYEQRKRRVTDKHTLARIRWLAIPPAWTDVWICADERGHLQATGRDARGRKQYRYHPQWRAVRDESKFDRILAFGRSLPAIRKTTARHLRLPGLPREKVLAAVVQLLEKTLIRVGNDEYARDNKSYGLTTILDGHVQVRGGRVNFSFRGKSGVAHDVELRDTRLAKIVKNCRDLPGQELFAYLDERGAARDVTSTDVNEYLREVTGRPFTAKDFRTWAGTILAALALQEFEAVDSQARLKKNVLRAIESVAKRLNNTVAVCRKCYIHPEILNAYMDGSMARMLSGRARGEIAGRLRDLRPEEAAVLALLQKRLAREAGRE